jgi:tetratricopeptide (TPR) repeat protein
MRKYQISSDLLMVIVSFLLLWMGCSTQDTSKIPITTSSNEARKLFIQGRELFERLQGQESLQYFDQATEIDSNFAMAYLYSSFSQPTIVGFFEKLNKAVALEDQVSPGEQLWIQGVEQGANAFPMQQQDTYKQLVEMYPDDERAHTNLGNNYYGQQQYQKAVDEYKKVLAINPNFAPVYNQLGYSYRFLGNYDEAEKAFQKYIELVPDAPNPYDSYAELLMKQGKFEVSIQQYQKALEKDPNFVASHVGIASDYNFLGEYDQARDELQKLFYIARNEGEQRAARFAMTVSYADQGNYDKALDELQWQFELGKKTNDVPNMTGDLITMGNILIEQGKYDQAQERFDEANKIMQDSDMAQEVKANTARAYLFNSAWVALEKNKMKRAKELAQEFRDQAQAANNTFQIWLAHQMWGMIALKEKNYKTAIDELLQSNLQNPYNMYRLAQAYQGNGDIDEAKTYYQKAAHDYTLNSLQYAFVRNKAEQKLKSLPTI